MNAIELLRPSTSSGRLFDKLRRAAAAACVFNQIADALAIHGEIEERIFYPAVKAPRPRDPGHSSRAHRVKWAIAESWGSTETTKSSGRAGTWRHVQHTSPRSGTSCSQSPQLFGEEKLDELGDEMDRW